MSDASNKAFVAENLALSWDGETFVTSDVSLVADVGEVVCLVGKSGCGKTTILHALAGLTRPSSGRVLLHGQDISGEPGQVSYMLQKDLLLPNLTIRDNVCLPLLIEGQSKASARAKVEPLFERFGLEGTQELLPSQLSGGMRQRAAFMRTYLMGNDVVLLDEPFSALDAITRGEMRDWYVGMARELGLASVMVTHDVDEAVLMADRIYVLVGDPRCGVPTKVGACIEPDYADDKDFALSEAFLEAKCSVLSALEKS